MLTAELGHQSNMNTTFDYYDLKFDCVRARRREGKIRLAGDNPQLVGRWLRIWVYLPILTDGLHAYSRMIWDDNLQQYLPYNCTYEKWQTDMQMDYAYLLQTNKSINPSIWFNEEDDDKFNFCWTYRDGLPVDPMNPPYGDNSPYWDGANPGMVFLNYHGAEYLDNMRFDLAQRAGYYTQKPPLPPKKKRCYVDVYVLGVFEGAAYSNGADLNDATLITDDTPCLQVKWNTWFRFSGVPSEYAPDPENPERQYAVWYPFVVYRNSLILTINNQPIILNNDPNVGIDTPPTAWRYKFRYYFDQNSTVNYVAFVYRASSSNHLGVELGVPFIYRNEMDVMIPDHECYFQGENEDLRDGQWIEILVSPVKEADEIIEGHPELGLKYLGEI
jgi:hypothetical protein